MLRKTLIGLQLLSIAINFHSTDGLVSGYTPGRFILDKNPLSAITTQYVVARFCDKSPLWIQLWENVVNSPDRYRLVSETEMQPTIGNCSVEVVKLNETVTVRENALLGILASSDAAFSCLYDPEYGDMRVSVETFPVAAAGEKIGKLKAEFIDNKFPYTVPLFFCRAEDCGDSIDNLAIAENRSMIQKKGIDVPSKIANEFKLSTSNNVRLSTLGEIKLSTIGEQRLSTLGEIKLSTIGEQRLSTFHDATLPAVDELKPSTTGEWKLSISDTLALSSVHGIKPSSSSAVQHIASHATTFDEAQVSTVDKFQISKTPSIFDELDLSTVGNTLQVTSLSQSGYGSTGAIERNHNAVNSSDAAVVETTVVHDDTSGVTVAHTTIDNRDNSGVTVAHTTVDNRDNSGVTVSHTTVDNRDNSGVTVAHTIADYHNTSVVTVSQTTIDYLDNNSVINQTETSIAVNRDDNATTVEITVGYNDESGMTSENKLQDDFRNKSGATVAYTTLPHRTTFGSMLKTVPLIGARTQHSSGRPAAGMSHRPKTASDVTNVESSHGPLTGLLIWAIIASLLLLCVLVAVTTHCINKMVEQKRFRGHHRDSYPVANDPEDPSQGLNDEELQ